LILKSTSKASSWTLCSWLSNALLKTSLNQQAHSELTNCLILSSVSEEAHGSSLGGDAYLVYEQALKEASFSASPGAKNHQRLI
jgi:hypothetical protein